MRTRRIAVVGLDDDAAHALHSMLKIVDGRSGVSWALSAPEHADVLLAGEHSGSVVLEAWARGDKPLITVHEGRSAAPITPYTLRHPFRVMQLLTMLDDVEAAIDSSRSDTMRTSVATGLTPWSFGESLRVLVRRSGRGRMQVAGYGEATVFVQEDGLAYYASASTVERLRREWLPLPALEPSVQRVPDGFIARPLFELAWFSGLHGPAGLAPWLDPQAAYHLRRWPDFGLVRSTRSQLAMTALLVRATAIRAQLCEVAHQTSADVDRFLNACSLAGLLVCAADTAAVRPPAPGFIAASTSRVGSLIRGLRARLGLAG